MCQNVLHRFHYQYGDLDSGKHGTLEAPTLDDAVDLVLAPRAEGDAVLFLNGRVAAVCSQGVCLWKMTREQFAAAS